MKKFFINFTVNYMGIFIHLDVNGIYINLMINWLNVKRINHLYKNEGGGALFAKINIEENTASGKLR